MRDHASTLARELARRTEEVCRHYLSNGRREGRYWRAGSVANTEGRSLLVRLQGPLAGKGAVGRWIDLATAEYGDLLDLIAANRGLDLSQACQEARRFLALPMSAHARRERSREPLPSTSPAKARRLFAASKPIWGTVAHDYLRNRGIVDLHHCEALRFHPRSFYRVHPEARFMAGPALIAAITDLHLNVTGVQRTWLDPSGTGKAPLGTPRRTMGRLLGHGVRFGFRRDRATAVMAAGEGVETMLSLRMAAPTLPALAALSASHLAAIAFPPALKRLYVACDNDRAGLRAAQALIARARSAGIEAVVLAPRLDDFNTDLLAFGARALREALRTQFAPKDVCFLAA